MKTYPNCKINLGLHIMSKRPDGYHDLETIFLPVGFLTDELEISKAESFSFRCEGLPDCETENNIVVRTYRAMEERYAVPAVSITLNKHIPTGAGLGGGSADAAFTAMALSEMFSLGLSRRQLMDLLSPIGADCPFFVLNQAALATGIGDILEPMALSLDDYVLAIVKPPVSVPTRAAYSHVVPRNQQPELQSGFDLHELAGIEVEQWKSILVNDFEKSVFEQYPQIAHIKQQLYDLGAAYSAMSGSGSAVIALFKKPKAPTQQSLADMFKSCFTALGQV